MPSPTSLFTLRAVSKYYDGQPVLQDFSITIPRGQWVGILGESGSGKSTLLQIAGRFLDGDEGSVFLRHAELPPVASQLLKGYPDIKLVHQEYHLFPNQTVRENVHYPIRLYPDTMVAERTDQLLALCGLTELQHQKAKFLSGGEKQRTAIAAALADLPQMLLMDEPFAHLDGLNRSKLTTLFRSLKKAELQTCMFATHDPTEALDWADYLVVLKKGQIVQKGTPQAIYHTPATPYVAELTGPVNWLDTARATCIRPEHIRVSKVARSSIAAKITAKHFRGNHWVYEAAGSHQFPIQFYRLKNDLQPGNEVFLRFPAKEVIAFPAGY